MPADLSLHEYHVDVRNRITGEPYVTSEGLSSLDIPYESCELDLEMFEAKQSQIPRASIKLPSLIASPELRPLFQMIDETDRVEIYEFQPSCGDPVLAGIIPVGGITEGGGQMTLEVHDSSAQARLTHVLREEIFLTEPAETFYDRGMSRWVNLVNEDFALGAGAAANYVIPVNLGMTPFWGTGFLRWTRTAVGHAALLQAPQGKAVRSGETYLLQADVILRHNPNAGGGPGASDAMIELCLVSDDGYEGIGCGPDLVHAHGYPDDRLSQSAFAYSPASGWTPAANGTTVLLPDHFPVPWLAKISVWIRFGDTQVSMVSYVDRLQVFQTIQPWGFSGTPFYPSMIVNAGDIGVDLVRINSWRCRQLLPFLNRAGRFVPQSTDPFTYQPNGEEALQLLQLTAERDNAEYRVLYRAHPARDEVELDEVGTLGIDASRTLGYSQSGDQGASPQTSPFAGTTDEGAFTEDPPFRFEEGYNLADPPQVNSRASAHANDLIRLGASTADSQVVSEAWDVGETGNPAAGIPPKFPYIEAVSNDDRVGLQSVNDILADNELARRMDGMPSLTLNVVDELRFAHRWKPGDRALTRTLSLRDNVDDSMRIARARYKAGSPTVEVTVGRLPFDPAMRRAFAEAMVQAWQYDESGSTPTTFTYPYPNIVIAAGATSDPFTISLDQFTTGTALIYAALHWYASEEVMQLQPVINGSQVYIDGINAPSDTDSGLVLATQYFQLPARYSIQFTNNDSVSHTLVNAFLALRVHA